MYPLALNKDGYTFKGENSVKLFLLPSKKGSTLNGKTLSPLGAIFFLIRVDALSEGGWCTGKQT